METLQTLSPDQFSNSLKNSESIANIISELFQQKHVLPSSLATENQLNEFTSNSDQRSKKEQEVEFQKNLTTFLKSWFYLKNRPELADLFSDFDSSSAVIEEAPAKLLTTNVKRSSKPIRYLSAVLSKILYVNGNYNYCYVYYADGRIETHDDCLRIALKDITTIFSNRFLKIHASYLVSPEHIVGYAKRSNSKDYSLVLQDEHGREHILPIARKYADDIVKFCNQKSFPYLNPKKYRN